MTVPGPRSGRAFRARVRIQVAPRAKNCRASPAFDAQPLRSVRLTRAACRARPRPRQWAAGLDASALLLPVEAGARGGGLGITDLAVPRSRAAVPAPASRAMACRREAAARRRRPLPEVATIVDQRLDHRQADQQRPHRAVLTDIVEAASHRLRGPVPAMRSGGIDVPLNGSAAPLHRIKLFDAFRGRRFSVGLPIRTSKGR